MQWFYNTFLYPIDFYLLKIRTNRKIRGAIKKYQPKTSEDYVKVLSEHVIGIHEVKTDGFGAVVFIIDQPARMIKINVRLS